jgi:cytochrome c-type biogenesis protein CcmH/NrfF
MRRFRAKPAGSKSPGAAGDLVAGSFRVLWIAALALIGSLTWAQTASEKPSVDTRRVGSRLKCQCGCPDSVASCSMLECSFSKPAKENIAKMQALGMSDQQIIDSFIRENPKIYLGPPNLFGVLIPYLAVGAGLGLIWWFIQRYRKPMPLAEIGPMELDDPALAKYKDQIEKDLANLE